MNKNEAYTVTHIYAYGETSSPFVLHYDDFDNEGYIVMMLDLGLVTDDSFVDKIIIEDGIKKVYIQ